MKFRSKGALLPSPRKSLSPSKFKETFPKDGIYKSKEIEGFYLRLKWLENEKYWSNRNVNKIIYELVGKENIIEDIGKKEIIETIGKKDVIETIGKKDVIETIGKKDLARTTYQEIIDCSSRGNRVYGYLGLARLEEQVNEKIKARDLAQKAVMDAEWDSAIWNESLDLLGKLNVELIFSNIPTPESKVYTVQPGDTLITIGVKLNTPVGMLCRANQLDESAKLRPNQTLKYTPKDFKVIVERSKCRAFLVDEQGIFKRYKVGLGKPGHETTLGSYKIGNKQKNPTWFKPGEGAIPPGDPRNELGTRWMPLVPAEPGLPTDLGLHGTIAPETIGTFSSNGCVRFYPEEVEELYDLIVRSTPVIIKEEVKFEDVYPLAEVDTGQSEKDNTTPDFKNNPK